MSSTSAVFDSPREGDGKRGLSPTSLCICALAGFASALAVLLIAASPSSAYFYGVSPEPATNVKSDRADLNGSFANDGSEVHYYYEWGETEAYGHATPAPPGLASPGGFMPPLEPVTITGLSRGTTYHYRFVATDADSKAESSDATFTTPALDDVTAEAPTGVTDTGAELNGSYAGDPGNAAQYFFEWGETTAYGHTTPAAPGNSLPAGSGTIQVPPVAITGLEGGVTYHYRLVVKTAAGTVESADASFKAADAPSITGVRTTDITESGALLHGRINPHWGNTTYSFEWGTSSAYGNSTPVPAGELAGVNEEVAVEAQLGGLNPGLIYHFRLVATNQFGTVASPDQTFGFHPPPCPNSQVRQETRSNDLPDCRAYELVSPSFAQGAVIMPAGAPTSPFATNPARLAYGVNFGLFPEETGEGLNALDDLYVSTRTDTKWIQRYVGLPGNEAVFMGGPPGGVLPDLVQGIAPASGLRGTQGTPSLDRMISYNWGYPGQANWKSVGSNAPYVWESDSGTLLERWPSNFSQVTALEPASEHFTGFPQASPDFSHFVFSSNYVFAEGGEATPGEIKCCADNGGGFYNTDQMWPEASVYDNDVKTGTVVLASRTADGTPFQGRAFNISQDGSHILITKGSDLYGEVPPFNEPSKVGPLQPQEGVEEAQTPGPLYLRVDATKTYEIAPGHPLQYAGSTADGETVYLTSVDPLTPDDHDSSRDLFVWHESEPDSLTRVSVGDHGTAGDTDECTPNGGWTTGCGVSFGYERKGTRAEDGEDGNGHSDSYIASGSGDIYFESPEKLVGQKGEQGESNLYLYRNGTVRYVTTMDPEHRVARMQVTPNGQHMAVVTGSNLTEFDSSGKREMYQYDPESGRIACASCSPENKMPTSDVHGSQNGLFQTFDGRTFFSTRDPLVPRDTNKQVDVYEYTEGTPRLITSGIGPGLAETGGYQATIGLIGVSANGTDVYFMSTDNLVTQDHNGAQLKIYDARSGGGYPADREEPKCTAADECHGPSSTPPGLPPNRTGVPLGTPVKTHPHRKHKHKHGKKHRHKKKRHAKGNVKRRASRGKQGGKRHG